MRNSKFSLPPGDKTGSAPTPGKTQLGPSRERQTAGGQSAGDRRRQTGLLHGRLQLGPKHRSLQNNRERLRLL